MTTKTQKFLLSLSSIAIPLITALVSFNLLTTQEAVGVTGVVTAISNVFHTLWEPNAPVDPSTS